jgi:signal transduction histidine kinase
MAAYLVFQLVWWGWQLYKLQFAYLQHLKSEGAKLPENALRNKIFMIIGEGGVFLLLLFLGIWWIKKNVWQDLTRAQKEKNFLLAVTHELKTPIAAIRLNTQTLKNRKLTEEQSQDLCADIITESNRLETLVNNILLATQFEQNTVLGNWQKTDSIVGFYKFFTLSGYGSVGVSFFFLFYTFSTREKAFYLLFVQTCESLYN